MPLCLFCRLDINPAKTEIKYCRIIHLECSKCLKNVKRCKGNKITSLSQSIEHNLCHINNIESMSIEQIELIIRSCHN